MLGRMARTVQPRRASHSHLSSASSGKIATACVTCSHIRVNSALLKPFPHRRSPYNRRNRIIWNFKSSIKIGSHSTVPSNKMESRSPCSQRRDHQTLWAFRDQEQKGHISVVGLLLASINSFKNWRLSPKFNYTLCRFLRYAIFANLKSP